jgi:transcriptional regulator with XRE-family HTH domain
MNSNDFGLLLQALRKTSTDERGNRWTRDSLSEAIHLTKSQLGRLERGDRKYLDRQLLQLLADAFKLTNFEQRELLLAAAGISDDQLYGHEQPENQLNHLLSLMSNLQVPAFILDVYGDLVAVNSSLLALYQVTPDLVTHASETPAGMNFIYFVYSEQFGLKNMLNSEWREAAYMAMLFFRRSSLRYRHTLYFSYLFKALLKEKHFDIDWYTNQKFDNHADLTYEQLKYHHPHYGPLSYIATETTINTARGELFLIIYNPTSKETFTVFSELQREHGNSILRLANWPDKIWCKHSPQH